MPEFNFRNADELLAIFESLEEAAMKPDGVALRWSNPLMVMVLSLDILYVIKKQFRSLTLRVNDVIDKVRSSFIKIYENYEDPEKLEILLKQKDLDGKTVLQYINDLKYFDFLQINHVNRIVNGLWNSKTDVGGSLFEMSTSYDLCCRNKLRYLEDKERRGRFYEPREITYATKDHRFGFNVWKRSLSLRYLIESLIFFIAMAIFQSEISNFNSNLQLTIIEVYMYQTL